MKDKIYTAEETAKILRLSEESIRDWCNAGRFPNAFKSTRKWLIPEKDIKNLIASLQEKAQNERKDK